MRRRSVCPILTPSLLSIGLEKFVRIAWAPPELTRSQQGVTTWRQDIGGHKVSSADLWGRLTPCGPQCLYAFAWWLSGGSSSHFQVSTGFGGSLDTFVGHKIHVMHTCRFLIRRVSLPWIGDIRDPWYLAWQPLLAGIWRLGLMWWKDEVCFCSICCAKCLHSNIHRHLWNLSV
jgi:hypothetical protein